MTSGSSPAFTFLQLSDIHLDSKLSSSQLLMPPAQRQERGQETLQALLSALELAKQRRVDAVLIPGDLWDSESITSQTVNRVIESVMSLGDIPVLIAPGNHDYCGFDSLYHGQVLAARGMRRWPGNVHIFTSPDFSNWKHPLRGDVSFTGRAFNGNVQISQRLLTGQVDKDNTSNINILLFHGSLDGYKGKDSLWPGKHTAPFSAAELENLQFTYAAIGHYHSYTEIRSSSGDLLGAYSGCLTGRGLDEMGPHYALLGSIDAASGQVSLEKVELDSRRIVEANCDITGLTTPEIESEARAAIAASGGRQTSDIVVLNLEGRFPVGGEPTQATESIRADFYHLLVKDSTRPDYLSDKYDRDTTEGKFIQTLLDLKKQAEMSPNGLVDSPLGEPLSADTIEDALYFGLDALRQKKVVVRHVD